VAIYLQRCYETQTVQKYDNSEQKPGDATNTFDPGCSAITQSRRYNSKRKHQNTLTRREFVLLSWCGARYRKITSANANKRGGKWFRFPPDGVREPWPVRELCGLRRLQYSEGTESKSKASYLAIPADPLPMLRHDSTASRQI